MAQRIRPLTLLLCLLGGTAGLPGLRAQPPPPAKFDFHVASHGRPNHLRYGTYDAEGNLVGSVPLAFKTSGPSALYAYEGPMPLVFFEEIPQPTPEDPAAVRRNPLGQIILPAELGRVLLLFHPNPPPASGRDTYRIHAVDLNDAAIPAGHLAIFNFTQQKFFGSVATNQRNANPIVLEVQPGLNPPVSIYPRGWVSLSFLFDDENLLRVYDNSFESHSEEKLLLVIYPPRFPGSPNVGGKLLRFPVREAAGANGVEPAPPEASNGP